MSKQTRSRTPKRGPGIAAVTALLFAGLTACGDASESNQAPTSPASSDGASSRTRAGNPKALGIDTVKWPTDQENVRALLQRLPKQVAGFTRKGPGIYGRYKLVLSATSPTKEVPDPESMLAASFGLGMVCKPETYVGTATPLQKGLGPGLGPGRDGELWWFACDVGGVEGGGPGPGFAVGWVSGELAWLLTAPDKAAARELINELQRVA